MSDLRHSRHCLCDGCERARAYLGRAFPDPQKLYRAVAAVWPNEDPDDTHAHTQELIAAYRAELVAAV